MVYFAHAAGRRAGVGLAIVGGIVGYYVVWALLGLFTKGGVVLPGQT